MIEFKFNEIKTTQAASLFLKNNSGKMSYMKLIKLLYLVDRQALKLWERPLTGDVYFSMKHGPVLSNVLDIINNGGDPEDNSYWYEYITAPSEYEVELKKDSSELDALSKRELELITEIDEAYKDISQWDMVEICHNVLPEWENVGSTSKLIKVEKILEKLDKTNEEINAIEEEVSNLNYIKEILSIDD
ncbi:MAG: SocA family protein [Candidatus Scalindua sp.]|nr:SocA family protein [Candidatus Scalindua sp.]